MSSKKKMTNLTLSLPTGSYLPATVGSGSVPQGGAKKKKKNKARSNGTLTSAFAAQSLSGVSRVPRFQNLSSSDGRVRVAHREYLCDVIGTAGFGVQSISIQPALPVSFPWLSGIAALYESYAFQRLRFEFATSVGTASVGNVMLAVDYDAFDYVPLNKSEFLQQHAAVRTSVWSGCALDCDSADLSKMKQRYTRRATLAQNLDLKTYDVGQLQIATSGCSEGLVVGELYVSYVVDLMTPQPSTWRFGGSDVAEEIISTATGLTKQLPYGTAEPTYHGDVGVTKSSSSSLRFDRIGEYLLEFITTGTDITSSAPTVLPDSEYNATVRTIDGTQSGTVGIANVAAKILKAPSILSVVFPSMAVLGSLKTRILPYDYSL